ncbi:hypothetical protein [Micromonospora sp. DT233]
MRTGVWFTYYHRLDDARPVLLCSDPAVAPPAVAATEVKALLLELAGLAR